MSDIINLQCQALQYTGNNQDEMKKFSGELPVHYPKIRDGMHKNDWAIKTFKKVTIVPDNEMRAIFGDCMEYDFKQKEDYVPPSVKYGIDPRTSFTQSLSD